MIATCTDTHRGTRETERADAVDRVHRQVDDGHLVAAHLLHHLDASARPHNRKTTTRTTSTNVDMRATDLRRQQAIEEVDVDVAIGPHRRRHADEDHADQQVARDLLGPRRGVVEHVACEELVEDVRPPESRRSRTLSRPRTNSRDRSIGASSTCMWPSRRGRALRSRGDAQAFHGHVALQRCRRFRASGNPVAIERMRPDPRFLACAMTSDPSSLAPRTARGCQAAGRFAARSWTTRHLIAWILSQSALV